MTNSCATSSWVAHEVKKKVQGTPHYTTREFLQDMKDKYGVEIPYKTAYRGLEIAKGESKEAWDEGYASLDKYLYNLQLHNPQTMVHTQLERSKFRRLFEKGTLTVEK